MSNSINNYFTYFLTLIVSVFFISSCQVQEQKKNIEPVIDAYVNVWNTGNINDLDTIAVSNFELRMDPTFEPIIGLDSLKKEITDTRKTFPDFKVNIDKIVLTGDTAVVATWTMEGTYSKDIKSPSAGKKMSVPGFSVVFFADNKITGEWIAWSDLTVMKQLGFSVAPPKDIKK